MIGVGCCLFRLCKRKSCARLRHDIGRKAQPNAGGRRWITDRPKVVGIGKAATVSSSPQPSPIHIDKEAAITSRRNHGRRCRCFVIRH